MSVCVLRFVRRPELRGTLPAQWKIQSRHGRQVERLSKIACCLRYISSRCLSRGSCLQAPNMWLIPCVSVCLFVSYHTRIMWWKQFHDSGSLSTKAVVEYHGMKRSLFSTNNLVYKGTVRLLYGTLMGRHMSYCLGLVIMLYNGNKAIVDIRLRPRCAIPPPLHGR